MYSKHQIQCLNELGIQGFALKPEFVSKSVSAAQAPGQTPSSPTDHETTYDLPWHDLAPSLLADLNVLLPEFTLAENHASFFSNQQTIQWRQVNDISSPNFDKNCLSSKALVNLTVAEKRELWFKLQSILGE